MYIHVLQSNSAGSGETRAAAGPPDSSKWGAEETGCRDSYDVIY